MATAGCRSASAEPQSFTIQIVRQSTKEGLIIGTIGVNDAGIGGAFENADRKIPAGTYEGRLRYWSKKNFVQGPFGQLGNVGDFLLEVADVRDGKKRRTDILFHAGNKPHHSTGCILLGPVGGEKLLDDDHPLRKLRRLFYDSDDPKATPDKRITIVITDPPA